MLAFGISQFVNLNKEAPCPRILFCSLSSKYALYKEVLTGAQLFSPQATLVGCDCDVHCRAAKLIDDFIELPRLENLSGAHLLQLCLNNKITHILPTRDAELSFWAEHKSMLLQHGINSWVSNLNFINRCNDKMIFFEEWKYAKVPAIQTFKKPIADKFDKWVAKERFGSGSRRIRLNISYEEALELSNESKEALVFQPFIEGQEFTVEAWLSRTNQSHGPILRWRKKVVDGESHETVVFQNEEYEHLLDSVFLHLPGAYGHCLAQVLVDKHGKLHLIEINPRLGGASPLALRAGLKSITWHLMEDYGYAEEIPQSPPFLYGMSLSKQGFDVSISD